MLLVTTVFALAGAAIHSVRPVTGRRGQAPAALGPDLRAAFDRVETLAPTLAEARHRHALRAVVRQSLDLREQLDDTHSEAELATAVDRASVSTAALARIDGQLRARDLHDGSEDTRELLHQRDVLAGLSLIHI